MMTLLLSRGSTGNCQVKSSYDSIPFNFAMRYSSTLLDKMSHTKMRCINQPIYTYVFFLYCRQFYKTILKIEYTHLPHVRGTGVARLPTWPCVHGYPTWPQPLLLWPARSGLPKSPHAARGSQPASLDAWCRGPGMSTCGIEGQRTS